LTFLAISVFYTLSANSQSIGFGSVFSAAGAKAEQCQQYE